MDLSNLRPADGSKQSDNFRRGRGHGSGNGKTAGKGHKGQKARSGGTRPGFEGGQMPLYRRIPKRGFTCRNSKEIIGINLGALEVFEDGATVSVETLIEKGIVKNPRDGVKILGNGELTKKLTVQANAFSAKAAEKIEALGGKAEAEDSAESISDRGYQKENPLYICNAYRCETWITAPHPGSRSDFYSGLFCEPDR